MSTSNAKHILNFNGPLPNSNKLSYFFLLFALPIFLYEENLEIIF